MLKVGITGGIGSGKTTVCRIFETLGIPVFYADVVAKQIMVQDEMLIRGIKSAITIVPTINARKTIMIGSNSEVRPSTALSTSSS